MKVILKTPNTPYQAVIDTEVTDVEIREAFIGATFVTEGGERLSVSMRDSGFEVHYSGDFGEQGFDAGWFEFKDGLVKER